MGSREALFVSREALFVLKEALFGPREALFDMEISLYMGYKCFKKYPKICTNGPLKDAYDTVLGGPFLII